MSSKFLCFAQSKGGSDATCFFPACKKAVANVLMVCLSVLLALPFSLLTCSLSSNHNTAQTAYAAPGIHSVFSISLSQVSFAFNGSVKLPDIYVFDNNTRLAEGTDYSVSIKDVSNTSVSNPIDIGTYTITAVGIGQYEGLSASANFSIQHRDVNKPVYAGQTPLSTYGYSASNMTELNVNLFDYGEQVGDVWSTMYVGGDASNVFTEGCYMISSGVNTGGVLDVPSASTNQNEAIGFWDITWGLNQYFEFIEVEDGYYSITAAHSGLALTALSNNSLVQATYSGANNQKWRVADAEYGSYHLICKSNGRYISVPDANDFQPGDYARLARARGDVSQCFLFTTTGIDTNQTSPTPSETLAARTDPNSLNHNLYAAEWTENNYLQYMANRLDNNLSPLCSGDNWMNNPPSLMFSDDSLGNNLWIPYNESLGLTDYADTFAGFLYQNYDYARRLGYFSGGEGILGNLFRPTLSGNNWMLDCYQDQTAGDTHYHRDLFGITDTPYKRVYANTAFPLFTKTETNIVGGTEYTLNKYHYSSNESYGEINSPDLGVSRSGLDFTVNDQSQDGVGFWPFGWGYRHFGMTCDWSFQLPDRNYIENVEDGYYFYFTGDDDFVCWIGNDTEQRCAIDLSGTHGATGAYIDFTHEIVVYINNEYGYSDNLTISENYALSTGTDSIKPTSYYIDRDTGEHRLGVVPPNQTASDFVLTDEAKSLGITDPLAWGYQTFDDLGLNEVLNYGGDITMRIVYLERGGCASNLTLDFATTTGTDLPTQVNYEVVGTDEPSGLTDWGAGYTTVDTDSNIYVGNTYTAYVLPESTAPGYEFVGWFTDAACTQRWIDGSTINTEDITLYGYWARQRVNISYSLTDDSEIPGSYELPATERIYHGDDYTVAPVPTATLYLFTGWSTDAAGSNIVTSLEDVSADTVLYGRWVRNDVMSIDVPVRVKLAVEMDGSWSTPTALDNRFINRSTCAVQVASATTTPANDFTLLSESVLVESDLSNVFAGTIAAGAGAPSDLTDIVTADENWFMEAGRTCETLDGPLVPIIGANNERALQLSGNIKRVSMKYLTAPVHAFDITYTFEKTTGGDAL